jgi:hypothetical protein
LTTGGGAARHLPVPSEPRARDGAEPKGRRDGVSEGTRGGKAGGRRSGERKWMD